MWSIHNMVFEASKLAAKYIGLDTLDVHVFLIFFVGLLPINSIVPALYESCRGDCETTSLECCKSFQGKSEII